MPPHTHMVALRVPATACAHLPIRVDTRAPTLASTPSKSRVPPPPARVSRVYARASCLFAFFFSASPFSVSFARCSVRLPDGSFGHCGGGVALRQVRGAAARAPKHLGSPGYDEVLGLHGRPRRCEEAPRSPRAPAGYTHPLRLVLCAVRLAANQPPHSSNHGARPGLCFVDLVSERVRQGCWTRVAWPMTTCRHWRRASSGSSFC
jgi:hypothetical protein